MILVLLIIQIRQVEVNKQNDEKRLHVLPGTALIGIDSILWHEKIMPGLLCLK